MLQSSDSNRRSSSGFNLLSFVVCVNVAEIYVKICHEEKLQVIVKMQMIRNQPKTVQNRRIFRTLAEMPLKLMQQKFIAI